jgi:hypothetical protein
MMPFIHWRRDAGHVRHHAVECVQVEESPKVFRELTPNLLI